MSNVLGRMRDIPQWFLWRMEWDAEQQKYQKKPCALDGSKYHIDHSLPQNWVTYQVAAATLQTLHASRPPLPNPRQGDVTYTLGFYLTEECNLWFFDLDHAVVGGAVSPVADALVKRFPGAMLEWSSSLRGMHVIGSGPVPPHRTKPEKEVAIKLAPLQLEFYNYGRGIAFGFHLDHAAGCADSVHDCTALIKEFFPYTEKKVGSSVRRPEWVGPEDDDELIRRFLNARSGAASAFGGRATLQQLWNGDAEKTNDNDMSLAAHLAFWTGCDGDRIERLMRRSGMVRDKWDSHRTYLRELTINGACASCERVYVEPQQNALAEAMQQTIGGLQIITDNAGHGGELVSSGNVITAESSEKVNQLMADIDACGTYEGIFNDMIPAVQAAGIPKIFLERIAQRINRKLDFFGAKMPIAQLRNILSPPVQSAHVGDAPEWMQKHCFVAKTESFFNCETGQDRSILSFNAEWSRMMPMKPNSGKRETPSEWAFHKWNVVVVDDMLYHPLMPQYFEWSSRTYVNLFRPQTQPQFEAYTEEVVAMIDRFNQHLYMLCGRRQEVYEAILHWIAHNVQNPGRNIRWSPLIKGVPGDGKSIIGAVMRAAMGIENVKITSVNVLKNTGGFTDWAQGAAVNVIEEIRLHGPARFELMESMKNFIDLDFININPKGKVDIQRPNVTNHLALTNFNDGLPIDLDDRRWMIVISPNSDAQDAANDRGLASPDELPNYFGAIAQSCKAHPGQWRQWLCAIDVSQFNPDGRAPRTAEKSRMAATSKDGIEELLESVLEDGGVGIHKEAFCSGVLSATVRNRALMTSVDLPKTSAWNQILARMGYEKLEKVTKWNGQSHRIWAKSRIARSPEAVIEILESTRNLKVGL